MRQSVCLRLQQSRDSDASPLKPRGREQVVPLLQNHYFLRQSVTGDQEMCSIPPEVMASNQCPYHEKGTFFLHRRYTRSRYRVFSMLLTYTYSSSLSRWYDNRDSLRGRRRIVHP